jgi:asparagine synthase (glutamine-hydrolysing)
VYDTVEEDEERHYSMVVARALGIEIEHHAMDSYRWFERWNEDLLPPEPSTEPMTAMMADLLDHTRKHGTVVLTGDGGDPLLMPTTVVRLLGRVPLGLLARDVWRTVWRLRRLPPLGIRSEVRRWWSRSTEVPSWLTESFVQRVDPHARVKEVAAQGAPTAGPRGSARSTMVDPWWTSMFETHDAGASERPVELRYPLFDVRLVSLALRLPTHPWCVSKEIVRAAMRGRLPEEICRRPKTPLAVDALAVHGRWTVSQAAQTIEAVPQLASYIDIRRFCETVRADRVMTWGEPGTIPAVALAMWLRCAGAASAAA